MSENAKPADRYPAKPGTFTSSNMRDLIFEHVIQNLETFMPKEPIDTARHMVSIMDSLDQLCMEVAERVLVNRAQLSQLPTLTGTIFPDPEKSPDDPVQYQLCYRMVEQVIGQLPHRDVTFTLEEATAQYGIEFVENYWGRLGERCPHSLQLAGNKEIWFTVCRTPVPNQSVTASVDSAEVSNPSRSPKFG